MFQRVHYRRAIGTFNMHTQVECGLEHEATPSLTDMRELAPPKSDIPTMHFIQSIMVEYFEEYIIIESMDSHVWDVESLV
jgi:hypothetical protein